MSSCTGGISFYSTYKQIAPASSTIRKLGTRIGARFFKIAQNIRTGATWQYGPTWHRCHVASVPRGSPVPRVSPLLDLEPHLASRGVTTFVYTRAIARFSRLSRNPVCPVDEAQRFVNGRILDIPNGSPRHVAVPCFYPLCGRVLGGGRGWLGRPFPGRDPPVSRQCPLS